MIKLDYSVNKRKPLTPKQRIELWHEEKGICCLCGLPIDGIREMWDEHMIPLADGGTNERKNRKIAHVKCARVKTAREATSRAHLRRAAEKHYGSRLSKNPMPGSRRSRWKRKMDGSVVPRTK